MRDPTVFRMARTAIHLEKFKSSTTLSCFSDTVQYGISRMGRSYISPERYSNCPDELSTPFGVTTGRRLAVLCPKPMQNQSLTMNTSPFQHFKTRAIHSTPGILLLSLSGTAFAHVKWFYQGERPSLSWNTFLEPLPLAFAGGALLLLLGLWVLQRARGGRGLLPDLEFFGALPERRMGLYGFVPAILAVHLAVPLFVAGVTGHLFSPDNALPQGWGYVIGLVQAGIALSLFYGGLTRIAAAVLAWLWLVGIALVGLEPMLDNALMLGFAVFFFLAGRGPISVDRLILPRLEPPAHWMRHAVTALRIGVGLGLISAAFTEKFANPGMAQSFLTQYPLNFTSAIGLFIPDQVFVLAAGTVELIVGLCLLLNVFTREVIVIAWVPINLTLTIFNWTELIGHLPIYGAMAVLLIWQPGPRNLELWVRGLREGPLAIPQVSSGAADD
jgi:uncharacterized membrane protein YphA (DoxX/SURF4 family)